jgi:hypothetical protein
MFGIGWFGSLYFHAGEQAMGAFTDSVSAIGYLEKGDKANAVRMMQILSERNVLTVSRYGTPILDWYEPSARDKWIQRYAEIRSSHPPIEYPGDDTLRQRLDKVLSKPQVAKK